ncbi:Uu.00g113020.m01.CDS01 [Anthostomella pinea]|uniref:Uu.00g113020.m01.CDS01 n=1 Tax=Anthostomella pinea TaxID=933095 RepID=A0AAI8VFA6_9PEZI|nr:Uu.00g113020.m01.CDS01 [Anthostomella pinea]
MRSTMRAVMMPVLRDLRYSPAAGRAFSTTRSRRAANQIYASVRRPEDFHTYQLLSSSSRTPLITLWTASYCATCRTVAPLIRSVIESGVGEAEGGVGYCTVEYDAPDIMADALGQTYMISSLPTLLSFDAGEAQVTTKVADPRKLADRAFLEEWVREEARRHGGRGGGGGGGGLFGGLFGSLR